MEDIKSELLRELDCIDHLIECGSLSGYRKAMNFAIENGYETICDIGCAYGHQSELFKGELNYIGINDNLVRFYNANEQFTRYIVDDYPNRNIKRFIPENTLAVSILCMGWECYKVRDDEFDRQFKALSEDFAASLLYMPLEREEILQKYYKNIAIIEKNEKSPVKTGWFYCY